MGLLSAASAVLGLAVLTAGTPAAGQERAAAAQTGAVPAPDTLGAVTLSWDLLAQVHEVARGGEVLVVFGRDVRDLAGTRVRMHGYMIPDRHGTRRGEPVTHFALSAFPVGNCFFCVPGKQALVVEVESREAAAFSREPVLVEGRLDLLRTNPLGLYYRLADAVTRQDRPGAP